MDTYVSNDMRDTVRPTEHYEYLYVSARYERLPINSLDSSDFRAVAWKIINKQRLAAVFKAYLLFYKHHSGIVRPRYYHPANAVTQYYFPEYGWKQVWELLSDRINRAAARLGFRA